ncbi:glycosyl transferase family 1 [Marinobacterium aestuarii]|uniref:Glycosyl transferase family 1 n=2 Tax=Marinobacterium aestuarii TaxID=1821621 RepID=A0A1A9EXZ9_9GAMM|nr:glycosyl transferase family 1 [Marinobacterium aestuarii]
MSERQSDSSETKHEKPDASSVMHKRRVLFFAEAVTLAHVARPMVLARVLEDAGYDVHFACHPRYRELFHALQRSWRPVQSISSRAFLEALAKGQPLYDSDTLQAYITEDLEVIKEVSPDLIIGDFRLSLSVSARLAAIPYMTITNAYWSPYARPDYRVPELPITRFFGAGVAGALFKLARPLAFALHTRPLNRVRKHYGLPSLGLDLRRTYTDADQTLYADLPELVPTFERPATHRYIGPINWSPSVALPPWWDELPTDKPIIYLTLGSSGQSELLPRVLQALAQLPVTVIVATAGLIQLERTPQNAWVADFLPGEQAASRASLVICNGGSPTTLQALAVGVPVIGIASNLDQYLNMSYLEQAGVGTLMRAGQTTTSRLQQVVETMMGNNRYRDCAMAVMGQVAAYGPERNFADLVARELARV